MLGEIFIRSLPTEGRSTVARFPVPSINEAPLIFTRVCKAWKEVAIFTPHLWCGLEIHVPLLKIVDTELWDYRICAIKSWLQRSGDLPLSLPLSYAPASLASLMQVNL
ncbi:hypothetical protein VKT23_010107 [Stygiomarasmius scandens]|uniref:F-box domain-containing protein n=1 Tax=Marasmiellus scandens TaxID=2682957 RepID=A0ABR1JCX7_9AGAR